MTHVAAPLFEAVGSEAYAKVAEWLRDVAAEGALGWGSEVHAPSVSWLAETVTMFDPATDL